jgi:succinoglycan biosynthesis protein ExoO
MIDLRFSVIIPVHNKARHVAASINSALGQRFSPHEVIVIDDASTDNSAQIIAQVTDSRLRLLSRDVPGPGGYAARNLGIAKACGNWIAFLDADDVWAENHLADIASAIERMPQIGCVATRYEHVFEKRRNKFSEISENLGPLWRMSNLDQRICISPGRVAWRWAISCWKGCARWR